MKSWIRYALCGVVGLGLGSLVAVQHIRTAGGLGSKTIGPWSTGTDIGTANASSFTRSVVALRGLLALPGREARYYNAATDSAGEPLDGRCRYRVSGGAIPARWWSLTLYDHAGYLVANEANRFSIMGMKVPDPAKWEIAVAPNPQPGLWLPTGRIERFELTFRTYLPNDAGEGSLTREQAPQIVKEGC